MRDALYLAITFIDSNTSGIPQNQINDSRIASATGAVMAIAGIVAVIFIILGGIRYSTSQGNPADVSKAKQTIIYAIVGLVFVIFAFAIVQFVTAKFS
jgi:TRAP-type C4-dicarboxylate transport system permease small subunit